MFGGEAHRSDTPVDLIEKCRRVNAYASQVRGIVAGWVKDLTLVIPPAETTWRLTAPGSRSARLGT